MSCLTGQVKCLFPLCMDYQLTGKGGEKQPPWAATPLLVYVGGECRTDSEQGEPRACMRTTTRTGLVQITSPWRLGEPGARLGTGLWHSLLLGKCSCTLPLAQGLMQSHNCALKYFVTLTTVVTRRC